jgi:predicted secreted protein
MRSLMIADDHDHVEVRLAVGEELEVAVEENVGSGFAWGATTESRDVVEIVGEELESPASQAAGAPGVRRFVVAARRAGDAVLTLELRRPWETAKPGRRVTVSVAAREATAQ